jgi:hypothetical protein
MGLFYGVLKIADDLLSTPGLHVIYTSSVTNFGPKLVDPCVRDDISLLYPLNLMGPIKLILWMCSARMNDPVFAG